MQYNTARAKNPFADFAVQFHGPRRRVTPNGFPEVPIKAFWQESSLKTQGIRAVASQ